MAFIRKPILDLDGRRFGHVVFYRLPCGLICRSLNPHTRKRILKDPRFAAFRKCSKRMAKASKIGSAVYKALPEDFRQLWMYRAFVGEAMKMLKEGRTGEETLESLFNTYAEVWYIKAEINKAEQKGPERNTGLSNNAKTVEINIRWRRYHSTKPLYNIQVAVQSGLFHHPSIAALSLSSGTGPP